MTFSWADKVAPAVIQPELPRADGAAYRAMRRLESASGIYDELVVQPRPQIYEQVTPRTLADYGRPTSKYAQRQDESDQAFTSRLRGVGLQNLAEKLPEDELATVAGEYNAAVERINGGGPGDHDQLRAQLDTRQSGTGVGLLSASPTERAAMVGRWGGRQIAADRNHTVEAISANQPASMAQVNAIMRQREEAQKSAPPEHTDVPAMRSTGTGFLGVDR
jgi:hypothetical protein